MKSNGRTVIGYLVISVLIISTWAVAGCANTQERIAQFVAEGKYDEARDLVTRAYKNDREEAIGALMFISSEEGKAYAANLTIQDGWTSTNDDYGYNHIRGRVKNTGDKTVRYFEVYAKYSTTQDGEVINTDYTNHGQDLAPGEATAFEIMHKLGSGEKWATLTIGEVSLK